MKVAICFYGLLGSKIGAGGVGKVIPPEESFDYYKKHIFDKNDDIDVFIHSWSHQHKSDIERVYSPKLSLIEEQIDFPHSKKMKDPINSLYDIKASVGRVVKGILNPRRREQRDKAKFRACSRWYSSKKVLELKKSYEEQHGFKYDMVMVTRFDVAFFTDLVFDKYDPKYFWASHWNDLPRPENNNTLAFNNNYEGSGFLDLWFFSNSENMDKFSELYDNIHKYPVSPHFSPRSHVDTFLSKDQIKYTLFRWQDFEMIRSKIYGILPPH
jgi:hypothetical protein